MNTPLPGPKATRREWVGLAVIALPCMVYAMDLTVLSLALPALAAALAPSASQLLWIVDIYGFFVAAFLIPMGTLGDRIGRRRLLLVGAACFIAASIVAAFSASAGMLIGARALLGVAGATLAPSTLSLIRNMFHDERERQFAIGVWIASFSLGSAIGPLAGGVLLQYFGWGSVFLPAVPVMLLLLALGPALLPEYRDPSAGRIDAPSVAMSLAAVLSLVFGLKQVVEHGVRAAPLTMMLAGVAIGAAFVRRQGRIDHPLLDLALLRRPRFAAAFSTYALACLAMFGMYFHISQYLQGVLGLSPLHAGVATLPWALSFVVGSLLTPAVLRRVPPDTLLVGGMLFAAFGFLMTAGASGRQSLPLWVAATTLISLGLAPVFTIVNEMIITAAPAARAGAASALAETGSELGGALGIALLGSLGTDVYRSALTGALPIDSAAPLAPDALATLGGTLAAAHALPGGSGEALAAAARGAFVDALQRVAWVGAAVLLLAGGVAGRLLRRSAKSEDESARQTAIPDR